MSAVPRLRPLLADREIIIQQCSNSQCSNYCTQYYSLYIVTGNEIKPVIVNSSRLQLSKLSKELLHIVTIENTVFKCTLGSEHGVRSIKFCQAT